MFSVISQRLHSHSPLLVFLQELMLLLARKRVKSRPRHSKKCSRREKNRCVILSNFKVSTSFYLNLNNTIFVDLKQTNFIERLVEDTLADNNESGNTGALTFQPVQ
jgi:hypothetical protein